MMQCLHLNWMKIEEKTEREANFNLYVTSSAHSQNYRAQAVTFKILSVHAMIHLFCIMTGINAWGHHSPQEISIKKQILLCSLPLSWTLDSKAIKGIRYSEQFVWLGSTENTHWSYQQHHWSASTKRSKLASTCRTSGHGGSHQGHSLMTCSPHSS